MKLLIHAAPENAECVIDGRPFSIPPRKVYKAPALSGNDMTPLGSREYSIPEDQVAAEIIRMCWHYGVVEVPTIERDTEFGSDLSYDAKGAIALAEQALIRAEETILANYVRTAQERTLQGLPAAPPNGRALQIITKRGIDLKKVYNIVPAGYNAVEAAANRNEDIDELKRQNEELRGRFDRLMASLEPAKGKKGE